MFETSFLLLIKALLCNIILPLIPGILFLWIFFGKKLQGMLLYILWRFIWTWVVAFGLFNLQFVHFGVGISEYIFLLLLLIVVFIVKIILQHVSFREYIVTLRVPSLIPSFLSSFVSLSRIQKIFALIIVALTFVFVGITFVHTTHFPTYADDSFGNRNGPAYNIYYDGWVHLFGATSDILWRGRLGYPIYIPLYKATVSYFLWSYNDIYINMWQRLVLFGMLLFVFLVTFYETKNIFFSVLPWWLIVSLPLLFFHASEWYMELPCAVYALLTLWALWKFLKVSDYSYITLALLLWFILAHIKNDWLLGYFAGIFITFLFLLLVTKQFVPVLREFFSKKSLVRSSLFYALFFFVPFLFIKWYHHLGFNQSVSTEWWLGITSSSHPEIFSVFKPIFFDINNYNTVLIIVALVIGYFYLYKKHDKQTLFLVVTPLVIFTIFVLVFLLTENYIFAMNQTTINRVFTMSFLLLFAFIWLCIAPSWDR